MSLSCVIAYGAHIVYTSFSASVISAYVHTLVSELLAVLLWQQARCQCVTCSMTTVNRVWQPCSQAFDVGLIAALSTCAGSVLLNLGWLMTMLLP